MPSLGPGDVTKREAWRKLIVKKWAEEEEAWGILKIKKRAEEVETFYLTTCYTTQASFMWCVIQLYCESMKVIHGLSWEPSHYFLMK